MRAADLENQLCVRTDLQRCLLAVISREEDRVREWEVRECMWLVSSCNRMDGCSVPLRRTPAGALNRSFCMAMSLAKQVRPQP